MVIGVEPRNPCRGSDMPPDRVEVCEAEHVRPVFDARSSTLARMTGWERYAGRLAAEFATTGDVEVWAPSAASTWQRLATDVRAVPLTRGRVVHFPTFPPQLVARPEGVVLTVHDLTWWSHPETASRLGLRYYRPALERAIRRCARIVTHSDAVAAEVCEHFKVPPEKVTPVYCGADFGPATADDAESPRDRPYLLTVGTLEPRKNLARLVEAYQRSAISAELDLVVVGRAAWGERPRGVTVLTGVDDETLRALYRGADAVVLASLLEGFGLPLVEALSLGTPVLASDIPVHREVTLGGAVYFDPLDVEAISAALDGAGSLARPDASVRDAIRRRYSWGAVADRLRVVYSEVAG